MTAILKKELNLFFSTPIGYLVIAVFLVLNGLFLWVFDGDFNILNTGFSDLNGFFFLSPWIFIFLIPAITMRMFSDEYSSGTIEILKTKPLSNWQIIVGKYLASLLLIIIAVLPTTIYIYSIGKLGSPAFNFDLGSMLGSYIGLLFLASSYTAIGLFASTLTTNQISSFIIAVSLCLFMYSGFEAMDSLFGNLEYTVQKTGMKSHFESLARGVIDTRDLIYFLSISLFFLVLTKMKLDRE